MKFWGDSDQSEADDDVAPWERYSTPSTDIETAAYALLSHLMQGQDSIPIVRWLTSKQNPFGGFSSTQVCLLHSYTNDSTSFKVTLSS